LSSSFRIRLYTSDWDDLEAITDLLHRAYAPLKEQGMWFVAWVQDVNATRQRLEYGFPFVAVDGETEATIGTITLYAPYPKQHCEW
jgi:hypothetical protein